MSNAPTQRIRLVLQDDQGLGRISLDLTTFLELSLALSDTLDQLERTFAAWETPRSRQSQFGRDRSARRIRNHDPIA